METAGGETSGMDEGFEKRKQPCHYEFHESVYGVHSRQVLKIISRLKQATTEIRQNLH
jgi:hypothetical protein